jgi:hypothetical protein
MLVPPDIAELRDMVLLFDCQHGGTDSGIDDGKEDVAWPAAVSGGQLPQWGQYSAQFALLNPPCLPVVLEILQQLDSTESTHPTYLPGDQRPPGDVINERKMEELHKVREQPPREWYAVVFNEC